MSRTQTYQKVAKQIQARNNQGMVFGLLAETFKTLGDYSRVQIVWALSHGELCVTDVADLLKMSPSAVSHHLRTLRNLHLVKVRRDHRTLYYSLDDKHINHLLDEGMEHVEDILQ